MRICIVLAVMAAALVIYRDRPADSVEKAQLRNPAIWKSRTNDRDRRRRRRPRTESVPAPAPETEPESEPTTVVVPDQAPAPSPTAVPDTSLTPSNATWFDTLSNEQQSSILWKATHEAGDTTDWNSFQHEIGNPWASGPSGSHWTSTRRCMCVRTNLRSSTASGSRRSALPSARCSER